MGLAALIVEADVVAAAPVIASWSDAQQTLLLSAACSAADQYIGRNLAEETATEWYDGSKSLYLNLKRWPVASVAEVKFDWSGGYGQIPGTFGANTILTQGTGYILDAARGILQLMTRYMNGDWFSRGYLLPAVSGFYGRGLVASYIPAQWGQIQGSVKVTYTAGYTQAPQDLVVAVAQIMTYMALVSSNGGLLSTTTSYIDVSSHTEVTQAIAKLRGGIPELGTSRQILDNYRVPYTGSWIL
jgi:hypothetical protein